MQTNSGGAAPMKESSGCCDGSPVGTKTMEREVVAKLGGETS